MPTILTVSYDSKLVETRDAILRNAGYDTSAQSTKLGAIKAIRIGGFDLLVICYSVPEADQNELIKELRKINKTPALLLQTGALGGVPRNHRTAVVQYSPDRFLDAIDKLLTRASTKSA